MKRIIFILTICLLLSGCGKMKEKTLEERAVGTWYDATERLAISKIKLYDTNKCTIEDKEPYSSTTMTVYNANCSWKTDDNKIIVSYDVIREFLYSEPETTTRTYEYELYDDNILRIVGSPTTEYSRES